MKSKTKKIVKGLFFSIFAFFALALLLFPANLKACEDCLAENETSIFSIGQNVDEQHIGDTDYQPFTSYSDPNFNMDNYYGIDNGLKVAPFWDGTIALLEKVNVGDIYYENNAANGFHHVGVVTGIKYSNKYKKYYIELIENSDKFNVSRGMLDYKRFIQREGKFYRVKKITTYEINKVLNYLNDSIGNEYNVAFFNCTTLVYEAFKTAGYELDSLLFPLLLIGSKILDRIYITIHKCENAAEYFKYAIIDERYHRTICYCGKEKEEFHITSGRRYCKYCFYNFGNSGGPSIEGPFSKKSIISFNANPKSIIISEIKIVKISVNRYDNE